jgi:nucleoside phosphorylase
VGAPRLCEVRRVDTHSAAPEIPDAPPGFLEFVAAQRGQPKPSEEQPLPQCEKLIFMAVPTEVSAIEFTARELGIAFRRCRDKKKQLSYFDLGQVGTDRVLAVRTTMGPLSHTGSAALAIQYRTETRAQAIISLGMAFGTLPNRQRIGDVLISTGVLPYDSRTVRTGSDGGPIVSYDGPDDAAVHRSNPELLGRFRRAAEAAEWRGRVIPGLLLSGGARIHCAAFRDELARECGQGKGDVVVGGDMEAVGFLSASDRDQPCWIVVKAISDFADHHRDAIIERSRPVACYRAARFVLSTMTANEEDHGQPG